MGKKILLADDSITIQKVIELTFSDEDFDVVTVGNGRLALERLPEVRPDIVLCDIIMPEKDGYEVCEQIKSSPAWSHVPVLLLTGAFEPFDQDRAARAGYDGSLAKPFEPETLIAKVKELLARAPKPAAVVGPVAAPPPRPATPPPVPSFMAPPVPVFRAVTPPLPTPEPEPSGFIPEEPFGEEPEYTAAPPPAPTLGEAERQALAIPEPGAPAAVPAPGDDSSTVMFRATDLPWRAGGIAPPGAITAPVPRTGPVTPAPVFVPEPEPEPPEAVPEVVEEETPVFDAVLEEDLEFGDGGYQPEPEPVPPPAHPEPPVREEPVLAPAHEEPVFAPETMAPLASGPAPESTSGAFAALVREQFEMAQQEVTPEPPPPAPVAEPTPEAVPVQPHQTVELPPPPPEVEEEVVELEADEGIGSLAAFEPDVPQVEPPAPVLEQEFDEEDFSSVPPEPEPAPAPPAPVAAPSAPAAPAPSYAPPPLSLTGAVAIAVATQAVASPPAAASFADVAPAEPAPAPSQAAGVAVPVDMVEKIAQRVIAQISEKAVREIAWEVIPDLAEAIIRQEIARLKAELAKL
ncbi:MAG TPA: response regulator [Vicinamibacteria bacterium]|nr:response regulator [Vicinamibacteria bacterium]